MRLKAFAKVNYGIFVKGLRDDGYHEVETVMQSISLADEVEIEKTTGGFELVVEPEQTDVGSVESNTVYRAWKLLCERAGEQLPVRVRLFKKIPSGAGLGGASADAAAVLVGLNELFGVGLGIEELRDIGLKIGADVPFCVSGGTAVGEGIGGCLTELPAPPDHCLVLLKPERSVGTARIYKAYDSLKNGTSNASVAPILEALRKRDLGALGVSLCNDLAAVTKNFVPEVAEYEKELLKQGALGASMSGTGTAVYGLFEDMETARVAARLSKAPFSGVYGPVSSGVEEL